MKQKECVVRVAELSKQLNSKEHETLVLVREFAQQKAILKPKK